MGSGGFKKPDIKTIINYLLIISMLLLLAGCFSGSGSDSEDIKEEPTPNPEPTEILQLGAFIDNVFYPETLGLSLTEGEIVSQGSAVTVAVALLDQDLNYYGQEATIYFSSTFSVSGNSSFSTTSVTTTNGTATTVYTAGDSEGTDTISASVTIDGETYRAYATLSIASYAAAHINFISTTPETIALKNTGGPARSESSVLVFEVTDEFGDIKSGQTVDFELSTSVGGIYLSNDSDTSGTDGQIQTTVNSGSIPTHVRVEAKLRGSDPQVSIVSDELLISTGLPDQNSITLGSTILNPEAWDYNNVEVEITFQAADHFNNFVPDGTIVYFSTEGGSIDDSCELADGACGVIWRSGNPRPENARVTYTAFCIGEESFVDNDSNGYFNPDDLFDVTSDMPEPFRDDDESDTLSPGEPWWDYDSDGSYTIANSIYNGSLCTDESEAMGLCTKELIYAQASGVLLLSGSFANITFSPTVVDLDEGDYEIVTITIADENNNPMPFETLISITTTNGTIEEGQTYLSPNTNYSGPIDYPVMIEPSEGDGAFGYLTVTVTTPHGVITKGFLEVYDPD